MSDPRFSQLLKERIGLDAESVGDAVMQMELAGVPMLVFRNEKHGGVNVVHRREDGNVGWIDPRNLA